MSGAPQLTPVLAVLAVTVAALAGCTVAPPAAVETPEASASAARSEPVAEATPSPQPAESETCFRMSEVTIHSRETIAKGDIVKHRFGWHVVTRVNPKSVTVALDWNDTTRSYKVDYTDVQGHHTAAEVEAARAVAAEKAITETAAAS